MKAHNLMEDIVKKYLDEMLVMRYDICTCKLCREDITAFVLSRIPPKYVTTETGAMHTLIEQVKVECASQILRELINAIRVVSQKPRHKIDFDKDIAYKLLLRQIKMDRGVDFSHYRDTVLKRRIALRMNEKKVTTYSQYLQILIHEPLEYEKLFEVLTINVSFFFRDRELWEKLREHILPGLINSKKQQRQNRIRIWSAGCANGEEAYSLAIIFNKLLEKEQEPLRVEISATDIDRNSLLQARNGIYDKSSLKEVSTEDLRKLFVLKKDKFEIDPCLKEMVKFKEHNLITGPELSGMDIIICRNVFIYFNRSLQEHLIMKFYNSLVDRGYFIMGGSETLLGEARMLFNEVDGANRVYQKVIH